ncbi:dienelactone hydrolase family protein [Mesorhizobium sp. M0571]|uniref:dienelactone hydrolase family protein n=1 Tax=Mesorhizobium sp. M0571 TaxID=2956960 RepID=UPI00333BC855
MNSRLLTSVAAFAFTGGATIFADISAAQTPKMGGGYKDVIAIPVDDPSVKAIAGALFKPEGAGPFPAVVYIPQCGGLSFPPELPMEKIVVDSLLSKGIATLIVDPFTPRGETEGVCPKLNNDSFVQYMTRRGNDAVAAVKAVKAMPGIDPSKVFLQGYSYGAIASLFATDTKTPGAHDTRIAGLIAYFPYCYDNVDPSVPTLVLIGEKDDWTPAANCQAVKGKANFEVVVYPGATHAFTVKQYNVEYLGHHMTYDEKATKDAQARADAFIAEHVK